VRSKTVENIKFSMVAAYSFLGSPEGYPTIDKYIFRHKQLLLTTPYLDSATPIN